MPPPRPLWDRFWEKVDHLGRGLNDCWPWTGARSKKRAGTQRGHLRGEEGRRGPHRHAHVVALALSTDGDFAKVDPETGERLEVCHRCGNRLCCNPRHLYWGTAEDNRRDRYGEGEARSGPR